ncbi:glycosyltransferase family 25 protein [Karstenula rhodostoma CBS 690.94]|uniref:Glycosyltransferase family 25 protein n=1 Tax=Karstenula rhodostoma CBS 690.94 TaxID=1392251 RepID=A0A9P4PV32_9PLEO|nr:glycosyltransferase family 25 protein [Karstenula rhodostoma CBS 690.94]
MPSSSPSRYQRISLRLTVFLAFVLLLLKFGNVIGAGVFAGDRSSDGIANQTLGFENIFVLNAPWRTDRKDAMSLAAAYNKIQFEWVDEVQEETIQEKAYPPGNHRKLSPGGLGSWRAHMDAMRE